MAFWQPIFGCLPLPGWLSCFAVWPHDDDVWMMMMMMMMMVIMVMMMMKIMMMMMMMMMIKAPENLKLAGNSPKVVAMCGLKNY